MNMTSSWNTYLKTYWNIATPWQNVHVSLVCVSLFFFSFLCLLSFTDLYVSSGFSCFMCFVYVYNLGVCSAYVCVYEIYMCGSSTLLRGGHLWRLVYCFNCWICLTLIDIIQNKSNNFESTHINCQSTTHYGHSIFYSVFFCSVSFNTKLFAGPIYD